MMYGQTLREYVMAMHQFDIVWMPKHKDQEPPF